LCSSLRPLQYSALSALALLFRDSCVAKAVEFLRRHVGCLSTSVGSGSPGLNEDDGSGEPSLGAIETSGSAYGGDYNASGCQLIGASATAGTWKMSTTAVSRTKTASHCEASPMPGSARA
jgi:hypothetical protein